MFYTEKVKIQNQQILEFVISHLPGKKNSNVKSKYKYNPGVVSEYLTRVFFSKNGNNCRNPSPKKKFV